MKEQLLLSAFRNCNERTQQIILGFVNSQAAKKDPERPRLHLVLGGRADLVSVSESERRLRKV